MLRHTQLHLISLKHALPAPLTPQSQDQVSPCPGAPMEALHLSFLEAPTLTNPSRPVVLKVQSLDKHHHHHHLGIC